MALYAIRTTDHELTEEQLKTIQRWGNVLHHLAVEKVIPSDAIPLGVPLSVREDGLMRYALYVLDQEHMLWNRARLGVEIPVGTRLKILANGNQIRDLVAEWPNTEEMIEMLAAAVHAAWAGWIEWMLEKIDQAHASGETFRDRWRRQAATSYAGLSEQEKESDRAEARRYLRALGVHVDDP